MSAVSIEATTFQKTATTVISNPSLDSWSDAVNTGEVAFHKGIIKQMAFTFPLQPVYDIGAARLISGTVDLRRYFAANNNQYEEAILRGPGVGNYITHTEYPDTATGVREFQADARGLDVGYGSPPFVHTFMDYSAGIGTFLKGTSKSLSLSLTDTAVGQLIQSLNKGLPFFSCALCSTVDTAAADQINIILQQTSTVPSSRPQLTINFLKIEPGLKSERLYAFYSPTNPLLAIDRELNKETFGRTRE